MASFVNGSISILNTFIYNPFYGPVNAVGAELAYYGPSLDAIEMAAMGTGVPPIMAAGGVFGVASGGGRLWRATRGAGFVDLSTPARRNHILYGDRTGGGHRPGLGKPGKSEWPAGHSDDSIMHDISDVATDPALSRKQGRYGRAVTAGSRNGVDITVIQNQDGSIVTGYPTNMPRNKK